MSVVGKILAGLIMGLLVGAAASAVTGTALWNQANARTAAGAAFWIGLAVTLVAALVASRPRFAWGYGFLLLTLAWGAFIGLLLYWTVMVGLPAAEFWGERVSPKGEGGQVARAFAGALAGAGLVFGGLILAILVLLTVLLLRAPRAAPPTYVAAPPVMPHAMPPAMSGGGYMVVLTDPGGNKIEAIKAVREITRLGLKESKDLVDGAPQPIVTGVSMPDAERIRQFLQGSGARVQIAPLGQAAAQPPMPQAPAWQPSPDSNPVRRA